MDRFDIVLIYQNNRRHTYYLNIAEALGKKYRIAVFLDPTESSIKKKQEKTDTLFLNELSKNAVVISKSELLQGHILIIPVVPYSEESLSLLKECSTKFKQVFCIANFYATPQFLIPLLQQMPVNAILAEDASIMNKKISDQPDLKSTTENRNIIDFEFIYSKYPALKNTPEIDYLIVFPTKLSFQKSGLASVDPWQKARFLKNVNKLIKLIPTEELILYKIHPVVDGGWSFVNQKLERLFSFIPLIFLNPIQRLIELLQLYKLRKGFGEIITAIEFIKMKKKCVNLADITPLYNFSVELFYPYVKKGVITGKSNASWGAIKAKIPTYNCDDNWLDSEFGNFSHLRFNAENFCLPPCGGNLIFDKNRIAESENDNKIDLIDFLENKLKS